MVKSDVGSMVPDILKNMTASKEEGGAGPMTDGTTILSCKYNGGIMLAADGRSSNSMFVGNACSDKLEPIHQRIYCQRSGTSAHTSTIAKYVRYYVDV